MPGRLKETRARLASRWLRMVSLVVPEDERAEWTEEWEAELWASGCRLQDAWGALPDAWFLRTEGWTMEGMLRDARMAVRALARKPFFTALAGITLAIGIGANTAIFSVVDGVLLNPLPYPDSDQIVSANFTAPGLNAPVTPVSEAMYLEFQPEIHTLQAYAAFQDGTVNLVTGAEPRRLQASYVTQGFFDVMAVHPFLGRAFAEGEDREGAELVAILGYGVWQESFGGDQEVIGRSVEMNGTQRRIVGVMPAGFSYPSESDVWLPLPLDEANPAVGNLSLIAIGRLAPGSSQAAAQAEMQELLLRFSDRHPDEFPREILAQVGLAPDVRPLKALYVQDVAQALWILLGTVGFILLIACANVANLFLVRAEARQREQALRAALGATRGDLLRQYLSESLTLAAGSGLLGLGLAAVGVKVLVALLPVTVPRAAEIGMDGTVLLFTAAISLGSGLLFGLFPLLGYGRGDVAAALKDGSRGSTTGRERHRIRSSLVVAQVGLALMLLVGSGLMARSFLAMRAIDPGFAADHRLTFRIALPEAEYPDEGTVEGFYRRLQERLSAVPGVEAAAFASAVPLEDYKRASALEAEDNPVAAGELGPIVDQRQVSPGYFATMGIQLEEGRELSWSDAGDRVRSVVVSQTLARTLWPGATSVVGRRLRDQGEENPSWEVVGVARNVRFQSLTEEPAPLVYFPLVAGDPGELEPRRSVSVALRVGTDPLAFVAAARQALREVDPRLPMVAPRTVASIEGDAMASTSFTALLLAIAAAIALVLGTVGIYGVVSYIVGRRTQEIGVRMALGAPSATVLREVMGRGMVLSGLGVALGLLGAWSVSRVLASLLYGVSATDPITYLGTAAVLVTVALLATWLPARRAARVDPVEALRAE